MTLETYLAEALARPDLDLPDVLELLASLAHDGVLVVDFRTDQAGEVLQVEFNPVPVRTKDDGEMGMYAVLVRPNDGSGAS